MSKKEPGKNDLPFDKEAVDDWIKAEVEKQAEIQSIPNKKKARSDDPLEHQLVLASGPSASSVSAVILQFYDEDQVTVFESEVAIAPDKKDRVMYPDCRHQFDTNFYYEDPKTGNKHFVELEETRELPKKPKKDRKKEYIFRDVETEETFTLSEKEYNLLMDKPKSSTLKFLKHPEKQTDELKEGYRELLEYVTKKFFKAADKRGIHGVLVLDDHFEDLDTAENLVETARKHNAMVTYLGAARRPESQAQNAMERLKRKGIYTPTNLLLDTQITSARNVTALAELADVFVVLNTEIEPYPVMYGHREGEEMVIDHLNPAALFMARYHRDGKRLNQFAVNASDIYNEGTSIEFAWEERNNDLPEEFQRLHLREAISMGKSELAMWDIRIDLSQRSLGEMSLKELIGDMSQRTGAENREHLHNTEATARARSHVARIMERKMKEIKEGRDV